MECENISDSSTDEIAIKYQKLASQFSKVRGQLIVLRKAVVDEQQKNQSLKDDLKEKDQQIRRALQEEDSLKFRNQQLTKRVEILQELNEASSNSGGKHSKKSKHPPINPGHSLPGQTNANGETSGGRQDTDSDSFTQYLSLPPPPQNTIPATGEGKSKEHRGKGHKRSGSGSGTPGRGLVLNNSVLQEELSSKIEEVANLHKKLVEVESEYQARIAKLEDRVHTLQTLLDSHEQSMGASNELYRNEIDRLQTTIASLEIKLQQKEKEIKARALNPSLLPSAPLSDAAPNGPASKLQNGSGSTAAAVLASASSSSSSSPSPLSALAATLDAQTLARLSPLSGELCESPLEALQFKCVSLQCECDTLRAQLEEGVRRLQAAESDRRHISLEQLLLQRRYDLQVESYNMALSMVRKLDPQVHKGVMSLLQQSEGSESRSRSGTETLSANTSSAITPRSTSPLTQVSGVHAQSASQMPAQRTSTPTSSATSLASLSFVPQAQHLQACTTACQTREKFILKYYELAYDELVKRAQMVDARAIHFVCEYIALKKHVLQLLHQKKHCQRECEEAKIARRALDEQMGSMNELVASLNLKVASQDNQITALSAQLQLLSVTPSAKVHLRIEPQHLPTPVSSGHPTHSGHSNSTNPFLDDQPPPPSPSLSTGSGGKPTMEGAGRTGALLSPGALSSASAGAGGKAVHSTTNMLPEGSPTVSRSSLGGGPLPTSGSTNSGLRDSSLLPKSPKSKTKSYFSSKKASLF